MTMARSYEKLGVFYLGKEVDPETMSVNPDYLLYDAGDLTTHAVCVGMTGSGKTGLCLSLLEEAAIDGIPVIAVDPKGDLGDLLLTFPDLSPQEFLPWINADEAAKNGLTPEEFARRESGRWREGLAEWQQDGERIRTLRSAAEFSIYTPGSNAGLPLSVLSSFSAPSKQQGVDLDLLKERISTTAAGLLGLVGISADPLRSREHILIANILEQAWLSGKNLSLGELIHAIQSPPLQRVGFFDLESFFPASERLQLAMLLNNLFAAPGFDSWMRGDPIDIGKMFYTCRGTPRVSIISIAHLSDAERMFFVTLLLNQMLGWMRTQPGTSSLRAVLYMDEIFGFLPPVAEPPSKRPLLTLLKQARAYGLGLVLATQNPADLDYKGLANTGTWFIGRLQTERDRDRLLDGMAGSAGRGAGFDADRLGRVLSALKTRVFLMQNAHEERPVLFHSRWALSYLAGPLTRAQIRELMRDGSARFEAAESEPATAEEDPGIAVVERPRLPEGVTEFFAPVKEPLSSREGVVCRPYLYGLGRIQLINGSLGVTASDTLHHTLELKPNMTFTSWEQAVPLAPELAVFARQPPRHARFLPLPTTLLEGRNLEKAKKAYFDFLYRQATMTLWKSSRFKLTSQPGESEMDFRIRLQQAAREKRDFELEKLRRRYAAKADSLERQLLKAGQRVQREREQYSTQKLQTAVSLGSTLLGALLGRKTFSAGTLGRATTTARQTSRIPKERQDVRRAEEQAAAIRERISVLDEQLRRDADRIAEAYDPQADSLQEIVVRPRKSDILVQAFGILWLPEEAGN